MVKMLNTKRHNPWLVAFMAYGPWVLAAVGIFLAAGGVE